MGNLNPMEHLLDETHFSLFSRQSNVGTSKSIYVSISGVSHPKSVTTGSFEARAEFTATAKETEEKRVSSSDE